jgi:hypothetical protein
MTSAAARGEVALIERAPSGDTSLIAVMDDDHHVGRLEVAALAAMTRSRECGPARCLPGPSRSPAACAQSSGHNAVVKPPEPPWKRGITFPAVDEVPAVGLRKER